MRTIILFCVIAIMLSMPKLSKADEPGDPKSIEITNITITGQPMVDSNVFLTITYKANLSGVGSLKLTFPGDLAPVNRLPNEISRYDTVSVNLGTTYTKTYPLHVFSKCVSWVSVSSELINCPENYHNYDYRFIGIDNNVTPALVISDAIDASANLVYSLQNIPLSSNVDLNIEGRVLYRDEFQGDEEPNGHGVYGVKVYLLFQNSASGNSFVHPIPGSIEHVHYAKCDIDGDFFFSFTGPAGGWNQYTEMVLLVGNSNDATNMRSGFSNILVNLSDGQSIPTYSTFGLIRIKLPINDNNHIRYVTDDNTNVIVVTPEPDGAILRNMQISKDFIVDRYSNSSLSNMPFTLPIIDSYRRSLGGSAGTYWAEPFDWIKIDPAFYRLTTCAHEYGHYVNRRMWAWSDFVDFYFWRNEVREGWPNFFGFATKNWANKKYNEYSATVSRWDDNNLETTPFFSNKFEGVSYMDSYPEVAQFSGFLWGLYDGNMNDDDFISTRYDNGDNDDISGGGFYNPVGKYILQFPIRVFEIFRSFGENIPPELRDGAHFKLLYNNDLPVDLKESIDKLWDFMHSASTFPRMRSAQINSLSTNWTPSTGTTEVSLSWADGSYPNNSIFRNFSINPSDGYNIYKSTNGTSWTLINSSVIPPSQTTYTYTNSPTIRYKYKITATNPSGDSYNPKYIDLQHVVAQIDGVDAIPEGETYTWRATPVHGKAPYSYKWYVKLSTTWVQVSTSSSYTRTCNEDFDLKLEVTDSWGESDDIEWHIFLTGGQWKKSPDVVDNTTKSFGLSSNYPNPFSIESTIDYLIPTEGYVKLEVFDVLGQQVDVLVNESLQSGKYSKLLKGDKFSAGNYLVKMSFYPTGGGVLTDSKWISVVK